MQIEQSSRAYRRGLILGWTLAEIFVLILFILLLAFAASYSIHKTKLIDAQKVVEKLADETAQLRQAIKKQAQGIGLLARANEELREQNTYLRAHFTLPNNFDDQFRELRRRQTQIDNLKSQVAALRQQQAWIEGLEEAISRNATTQQNPQSALRELLARADDVENAMDTLRASGLAHKGDRNIARAVKEFVEGLREAGIGTTNSRELSDRFRHLADCERDRLQMQGQLANSQGKLEALGRGTEMPACWASLDGKPEYIWNVDLTTMGVIVHDNALPDHVEDEKQFVNGVLFNTEIKPEQFLAGTNLIYKWSVDHKCRFFVKVFDRTRPDEKAIYKRHLQAVEGHFYKQLAGESPLAQNVTSVEGATR